MEKNKARDNISLKSNLEDNSLNSNQDAQTTKNKENQNERKNKLTRLNQLIYQKSYKR